mmetsp:Transcript_17743/g.45729  ORF Transcript_17743/g.45729 Transcript_17743/m.45729 type:complete len:227 (+) Transcript_17743:510-1190(+)
MSRRLHQDCAGPRSSVANGLRRCPTRPSRGRQWELAPSRTPTTPFRSDRPEHQRSASRPGSQLHASSTAWCRQPCGISRLASTAHTVGRQAQCLRGRPPSSCHFLPGVRCAHRMCRWTNCRWLRRARLLCTPPIWRCRRQLRHLPCMGQDNHTCYSRRKTPGSPRSSTTAQGRGTTGGCRRCRHSSPTPPRCSNLGLRPWSRARSLHLLLWLSAPPSLSWPLLLSS